MIGFFIKAAFNLLMLAASVYVVFFVPLGERTVYQHLSRIADTAPAQEFAGEVGGLVDRARDEVGGGLATRAAPTQLAPGE